MRRVSALLLTVLLAGWAASPARADAEKLLALTASKANGALAVLRFKYTSELGDRTVTDQAICVGADGLFLTLATNATMDSKAISDVELLPPGVGAEPVAAKFVGIDEPTGIGFFRATGKHPWKPLEFADKAGLYIGQPVASAGLLPQDTGFRPYVGVAYVSSSIRVPGKAIYTTGGTLTRPGSPVMNAAGKVVGLVHRQESLNRQFVVINNQPRRVQQASQLESNFFTPVEEFAEAVAAAGKKRGLSWIGVVNFTPVGEDLSAVLNLKRPGVMIDKIVPDTPAAKQGLQARDVIVALNGRPIEQLGTPALTAGLFQRTVARTPVGTPMELGVFRDGKAFTKTVTTQAMPARPFEAERLFSRELGLAVRERVMLDDHLDDSPAAKVPGLIVYLVLRASPALLGKVQRNDVVVSAAGRAVRTTEDLQAVLDTVLPDKSLEKLTLEVMRGDRKETLSLPLPGR